MMPQPPELVMTLTPRPWAPQQDPGPWLAGALAQAGPAPLLLLLTRPGPVERPQPQPEAALSTQLLGWLTQAERQRLAALRHPADQQRFLLGRAGLRRLLAALAGGDPAAVPIACGPQGKPICPGGPHFNVSHSGDLILLALHPQRPVGVDLERLRPDLPWRPLAARMLPAEELLALERQAASLPADRQSEAFLAAWCRLEARLKAHGCGLARRGALPVGGGAGERLWSVDLPGGYVGAAAVANGAMLSLEASAVREERWGEGGGATGLPSGRGRPGVGRG
jgi:4'-phosphopantetheinyl transferase